MNNGTTNARLDYKKSRQGVDLATDSVFPDLSAKHADWAIDRLVVAATTPDSRSQEISVATAQVYATLALRDKLDELTSVLKELRDK